MWEERSRHDWAIAARLMAQNFNLNRGKDQRAATPDDFDPWARFDRDRAESASDFIDSLERDWLDPDDEDEGD